MWLSAAATLAAALAWPVVFSSDAYAYAAYGELTQRGIDPYVPLAANVHGTFVDLARLAVGRDLSAVRLRHGIRRHFRDLVFALRRRHSGPDALCVSGARLRSPGSSTGYLFALIARSWFPAAASHGGRALRATNPLAALVRGRRPQRRADAARRPARRARARARRTPRSRHSVRPHAAPQSRRRGGRTLARVVFRAAFGKSAYRGLVSGYAIGLAVCALLLIRPMWPALSAIRAHGVYAPQVSLQSLTGPLPALILAACAALAGLRGLARGESSGALWLALAVPLALPNPYPWYMMWCLPVAAAARRPAGTWLWIVTIAAGLRYLPDALGPLRNDVNLIATALALAPLAVLAALLLRPAAPRREAAAAP